MTAPPETTLIFHKDIFQGKVVLCSGGGSGICRGMTEAMLRHGAKAAIFSRSQDRLEKAAKEMQEQSGQDVLAIAGDVRKSSDVEEAVKRTMERFGRIDYLICGAAGNFLSPVDKLSYNAFRTVIEIDLLGTYNLTKAALPYLKQFKGSIINVSATLSYTGTPMQAHSGSAKAAIDALTKHLAVEFGPFGVRVNGIAPGPIASTIGMQKLTPKHSDLSFTQRTIPLQRFGQIKDIEQATVFLFSEGACWITGITLVVDGGTWMTQAAPGYPDVLLWDPAAKL